MQYINYFFPVAKERLRLYLYVEKVAYFTSTHDKFNKTDSLQHPVTTGRLCYKILFITHDEIINAKPG